MSEPLITIIMPLKYYHDEFLRRSVGSIVRQSCPSWRLVIVVEEGDLDLFRRLLAEELADPRIDIVANTRKGFPGAINTGMRHAATPFVSILLADDMVSDDTIEVLGGYIRSYPEVDFFHSSRIVVDECDTPISSVHRSKEHFRLADFHWGSPVKHLLCWRREKGLAIGGIDESVLKAQDDYDFPWSMAEHGATFKAVEECLYLYRNHCECPRLTTHRPLSITKRGIRGILKKHGVGLLRRWFIVTSMHWRGALGKQCLYRNRLDRWIMERLGYDDRNRWSQQRYR
jgi:GT2 family glycosyltransferase